MDVSAALRRRISAARGVALLVPATRDDAGRGARTGDCRSVAGAHALRVGARAVLSPEMGRGGISPRPPAYARGFRVEGAGHHQARPARRAGALAPVRRLPVHRGRRSPSHPRHVRHHRPAHGVRDRSRRLGCDRQCACPRPLGHGPAARRHRVHRGDLQPVHGLVGHARRRRAPSREGVSIWRRRARNDGARRDVARPDEAVGVLFDAVVRAAPRGGRAGGRPRSRGVRVEDDVLLRRAGRLGARRARQDRRRVRRARDRLRFDGRNDAVPECCRHGRDRRHAAVAGRGLHRGLRPGDVPARAVRPAWHAGVHASRAHVAADDPARLGRPDAMGGRPDAVRAHVPAAAARHLRAHRRHVHDPRRERLSERGRCRRQRACGLRWRTPDRDHARRRHGRIADPHRGRPRTFRRPGLPPCGRCPMRPRRNCCGCSGFAPGSKSSRRGPFRAPISRRGASSTIATCFAK